MEAAEAGVVKAADTGVKGVFAVLGESSVRADRRLDSIGMLPDRRRVREIWRVNLGRAPECEGMTRGASCFGEMGCRETADAALCCSAMVVVMSSSALSSSLIGLKETIMLSARWCCFQLWPGALIDLSWSGGLPGMVARACQTQLVRSCYGYHIRESMGTS